MLPVIPLNPFKSQLWFGQQVGGHQSSCCHYHAEEVVTLRRLALWILSWVTVFEGSSHCVQFLPRQRRRTHLSQDLHSRPLTGLNCPINVSTPLGSRLCACPMNPDKRDGQLRDKNESCLKCLSINFLWKPLWLSIKTRDVENVKVTSWLMPFKMNNGYISLC